MEKKKSILKKISSIFGLVALCGLLGLGIFVRSNKTFETKASNEPVSSISNIDNYDMIGNFTGKFDFDWSYVTYHVGGNEETRYKSTYRVVSNPTSLSSLIWVANDGDFDFGSTSGYFYVDAFYSAPQSFVKIHFDLALQQINLYATLQATSYYQAYNKVQNGGWSSTLYRTWCFNNSSFTDATNTTLIALLKNNGTFYKVQDINTLALSVNSLQSQVSSLTSENSSLEGQVSSLSSQVSSLQSQVSSLTSENSSLEGQVSSLSSQVSSLQSQVSSLTSENSSLELQISNLQNQLSSAYSEARENTYFVNVNSHYEITYNMYININDNTDFYIKPIELVFSTDVDVNDGNGDIVEFSHSIVNTFNLSQYNYYYNYNDLYTFLHLDVDDHNLIHVLYYDGNDNQYGEMRLTSVNNFISNYQENYLQDVSFTGATLFQLQVVYYKNIIITISDINNQDFIGGYDMGYIDGYGNGKQEGYNLGKSDGYNLGIETNGTVATIFSGILQVAMVPVNFFLAIFNFEILGINLSAFIRALFTVILTIIVIKTVIGSGGGSSGN